MLLAVPLLAALSVSLHNAQTRGEVRVVFSGTSITCGIGASTYSKSFPMLLEKSLESASGLAVREFNKCYGGAPALLQLASLQSEALPLKPDVLVIEAGTLDALYNSALNSDALEHIFASAAACQCGAIALYPLTSYAAVPEQRIADLAEKYMIPLIDLPAIAKSRDLPIESLTTDDVHANDAGHALIAAELLRLLRAALSEPPIAPRTASRATIPPFRVRFIPASKVIANLKRIPLGHFAALGFGVACNDCHISTRLKARFIAVVFRPSEAQKSFDYSIDNGVLKRVGNQPGWIVSDSLLEGDIVAEHSVRLQVYGQTEIAGFLVSD